MIPSFEIKNYRLFKHLVIERLGRVNLITGKNNVGKTALLEALKIYQTEGSIHRLIEVLRVRDENAQFQESDIEHIFRYQGFYKKESKIILSPSNKESALTINFVWFIEEWNKNKTTKKRIKLKEIKKIDVEAKYGLEINFKGDENLYQLETNSHKIYYAQVIGKKYPVCLFVPSNIRNIISFIDLWEEIDLTEKADKVINCLRLVEPKIERISTKSEEKFKKSRIFIAKISDYNNPIPLNNLGEGIIKLLFIVLCLINAEKGIVLIDEIENGIHYSIQPKLWNLILEMAERLDVQVFATTHSWDAVEGFQEALKEFHDPEQGQLIRLKEKNGDIKATIINAKDLAIATRDNIEVR